MLYTYSSALDDIIRGIIKAKTFHYINDELDYHRDGMKKEIIDRYSINDLEYDLLINKLIDEGFLIRQGHAPFYFYQITHNALYLIKTGGFQKREFYKDVNAFFKICSSVFLIGAAIATILISVYESVYFCERNSLKANSPTENSIEGKAGK